MISCLIYRSQLISRLTANYEIKIQNTELYNWRSDSDPFNLNIPHDMRRLTFKNIVGRHKWFDCILDCFLIAIFGGLEQTSYKLFLLARDQWTGNCSPFIISQPFTKGFYLCDRPIRSVDPYSCWYPIFEILVLSNEISRSENVVQYFYTCTNQYYSLMNSSPSTGYLLDKVFA